MKGHVFASCKIEGGGPDLCEFRRLLRERGCIDLREFVKTVRRTLPEIADQKFGQRRRRFWLVEFVPASL
jgi:hypothetical protein